MHYSRNNCYSVLNTQNILKCKMLDNFIKFESSFRAIAKC